MPLEIVLVRHGQSEGNRDRVFTGHGPSNLTARGRLQAEATARHLAATAVSAIHSSDLPRALQTAAPLAALTGLQPLTSTDLRERDVGAFTGLTFAEVQERFPEGWQALMSRDPTFRPEGGESHDDCGRRVGRFLDELLAKNPAGRLVVYSHGVAINHMLRHLVGLPASAEPRAFFHVDNCSLSRFEHHPERGSLRILSVNETWHLPPLEG